MHRRYLVLSVGLAVALVAITPSFGGQHVIDKATFPVRTAKAAKRIAKTARTLANQALAAANAAQQTANEAKTAVDATAAELTGLRAKSDTDAPTVTTTEQNTYVDLGGPSVTVNVPASGLVEVWAQVETLDGAVSLYDGNQQVPGQDPDDACSQGGPPPAGPLLAAFGGGPTITLSTPGSVELFGYCGSTTAPAPVLFNVGPGEHTFSLRYASCGCNAPAPAEFTERTLTVAPRP